MTQMLDPAPPEPNVDDPWTAWGQPQPHAHRGGRSVLKVAAAVIIPLGVLAVLVLGAVFFLLTADPAVASGVGCGGG